MRILLIAAIVGLLFPGVASAKKVRSSKTTTVSTTKPSPRKAKTVATNDGVTRGRKRSADDPVLRRYGKKAEYVVSDSWRDRTDESSDDDDDVKPIKKPSKTKAKAKKVAAEEEILIIEETPAKKVAAKASAKKPPAKKAPAKKVAAKKPAKPADDVVIIIEE